MIAQLEMIGKKFGRLTVVAQDGERKAGRHPRWVCKCDCGNVVTRSAPGLRQGREPSCGCAARDYQRVRNDISGKRFGRLVALSPLPKSNKKRNIVWSCVCDCGESISVSSSQLVSGKTKSCGCLQKESIIKESTKHGHSRSGCASPTYVSWSSMLTRCTNPKSSNFKHYGGRGILVCDRWKSFENFLADMGERPDGMSIDRIDVDGNYEPSNCKWSNQSEQAKNQRRYKNVK